MIAGAALAAALAAAGPAWGYTWTVTMTGAQQTASHLPGDPDGSGTATITGDPATNKLCSTVSWTNVAAPVVAGHIHQGTVGQPEDPAFTINLFGPNINGAASGVSGCTIVPGAVIQEMSNWPMLFMVTIHNQQYPAGAIRGQLSTAPLCRPLKICPPPPPPT